MGKREYNEARKKANRKYNAKTYDDIMFHLRKDEDAEMLESMRSAQERGISKPQWLHEIFELSKRAR